MDQSQANKSSIYRICPINPELPFSAGGHFVTSAGLGSNSARSTRRSDSPSHPSLPSPFYPTDSTNQPNHSTPPFPMPPLLSALSFLVIATDEIAEWREFGTRVVAMMLCEGGEGGGGSGGGGDSELVFRMDERAARWIVTKEEGENCIGWDADAAAEDLEPVKAALASLGIAFRDLTADECTRRKVASGISFKDPEGNTHNVVLGAAAAPAAAPFAPARAISGFRTADMGMGHCVLHVKDTERMKPFVKALGFKLTDYAESPFKAHFYHLNARHHSLAMIETGKSGIHHIMLGGYLLLLGDMSSA